jgi:hypothetical protein
VRASADLLTKAARPRRAAHVRQQPGDNAGRLRTPPQPVSAVGRSLVNSYVADYPPSDSRSELIWRCALPRYDRRSWVATDRRMGHHERHLIGVARSVITAEIN